jgi:hypothetical protein
MSLENLLRARTPPGRSPIESPRPPSNVCSRPQIPASPAIDRRREVWLTPELVGPLLAHTEDLGDLNHSKELPPRHSP